MLEPIICAEGQAFILNKNTLSRYIYICQMNQCSNEIEGVLLQPTVSTLIFEYFSI